MKKTDIAKFTIKDSVFTNLFQDKKYLIQLYKALMYLMQSYHEYFESKNDNLYSSKKVKLLKPDLYVIFTGKRVNKPKYISLSEEFFCVEECALRIFIKQGKGSCRHDDDVV